MNKKRLCILFFLFILFSFPASSYADAVPSPKPQKASLAIRPTPTSEWYEVWYSFYKDDPEKLERALRSSENMPFPSPTPKRYASNGKSGVVGKMLACVFLGILSFIWACIKGGFAKLKKRIFRKRDESLHSNVESLAQSLIDSCHDIPDQTKKVNLKK